MLFSSNDQAEDESYNGVSAKRVYDNNSYTCLYPGT